MRKDTYRELIWALPQRWEEHYHSGEEWITTKDGKSSLNIFNEIQNLDLEKCSVEDIVAIIGDDDWITWYCLECNEGKLEGITIALDEHAVFICTDCLNVLCKPDAAYELRLQKELNALKASVADLNIWVQLALSLIAEIQKGKAE